MAVNFGQLLTNMNKIDASDLHIKSGTKPIYRINGKLVTIDKHSIITKEEVSAIVNKILPEKLKHKLKKHGACDFAFSIDPMTRFRTNAFFQRGMLSISLRRLIYKNLTYERLGLPPILNTISAYRRGMILTTGPTGTGKSTTIASIIEYINNTRSEHIVTIEDPIEFSFEDKKSLIEQREIGLDAQTFEEAVRHALRQDPDVILIGEMRDRETIQNAIRAGMTGHLVISTLHTINAVHTVNRVLKYFPPEEQGPMRGEIAACLRSVISQRLVEISEGHGRVPCVEIMIVNDTVKKLIREDRIEDIEQIIRNGQDGMQSFDQSLAQLVKAQKISMEVAEIYSDDVAALRRLCKGVSAGTDRSSILAGF